MSAQKISQFSILVKEEEEALDHLPTFTASATTDDPSFPPQSLFNSFHDEGGAHGDLHEFARHRQLYREPSCHNHGEGTSNVPIKWTSSKMRLMKKMMGSDQIPMNKPKRRMPSPAQDRAVLNQEISNGSISPSCIVRVCSDCNTTKTPLWRSGPHGPKSLCNACGIRQMKARRALMAASITSTKKEKNSAVDRTVPYKKRYKFTNHGDDHMEKLSFKDPLIELSRSSSPVFHPTFPQDDKDAAILLMTLSCGMIHGQVL